LVEQLEKIIASGSVQRSQLAHFIETNKHGSDMLLHSARRAAELIQNFNK